MITKKVAVTVIIRYMPILIYKMFFIRVRRTRNDYQESCCHCNNKVHVRGVCKTGFHCSIVREQGSLSNSLHLQ